MMAAIVIQFFVGDLEMGIRRMIRVRGELAAKPEGTDIRRVLEPCAPAIERCVGDGQRKFACLALGLPHGKHVLANEGAYFIPNKLNDETIAHRTAGAADAAETAGARVAATVTFFLRLARDRLGGVPSAGSTTIRLVTNFFGP